VSASREPGLSALGFTVLLAEDDEPVRHLAQRILERIGLRVIPTADGEAALAAATAHDGAIDLLLTDVAMPGVIGPQLARRFSELYPGAPVLFMSGHPDDALRDEGVLEPDAHFLRKPFDPQALALRVRELLEAS
jgi:two-component system, cell cycle sensor histidine kinase and response regulator CckA